MINRRSKTPASMAWLAVGGLFAFGLTFLIVRELPSIRREIHLMRM